MADDAFEDSEFDDLDFEGTDTDDDNSVDTDLDSDDEDSEDSDTKGSKKKFKLNLTRKMKIIIAASALSLILLIAGGIVAFKMTAGESSEDANEENIAGDKEASPAAVIDLPVPDLEKIIPFEPFLVPLKDDIGNWELNVTIELEASSKRAKVEIEKRTDEIREALIPILGKRRPNQLQSIATKIKLRTELIVKINKMLRKGKVRNLYFTQFIVL